MSLIVDASVAVKWFADEPGSAKALALYEQEDDLIAPTLIIAEVGNALWKKRRKKLVTEEQVRLALDALPRSLGRLYDFADLTSAAADFALRFDHPIYDCFYIALAQRERAGLVTADARMEEIAKKARVDVKLL